VQKYANQAAIHKLQSKITKWEANDFLQEELPWL